jgi:hypothetical protein
MRRIVVSEFVSLDGVFEDPSWTFRFGSEERERFKLDELAASDALLLGHVTYEGFAEAWPSVDDEAGFADRMNGNPKHVVSGTLREPLEWNNSTVIKDRRSSWRSFGRSTRRTHPHPLARSPLSMRGARPPTYGQGRQDAGPSPAEPRHTERRRRT